MYQFIRPLLFLLPPESAHAFTLFALRVAHRFRLIRAPTVRNEHAVNILGLHFPNRLGVAAGLDKNATTIDALGSLGFGFVEVGTVTPEPQSGNARPRLFRLVNTRALINRMGFPNEGADAIADRLLRRRFRGICGVNIGKNASTPLERAADDYVSCLTTLYSVADYFAINISSPNTAELRQLQHGDSLVRLLQTIATARASIASASGRYVPILVKLSADLSEGELIQAANAIVQCRMDGVIAVNTTVDHRAIDANIVTAQGGLSGVPLFAKAIAAIKILRANIPENFPLIGVGGVSSPADALAMRSAGADLVQIYSALIFQGPNLIRELRKALTV